jgi:hypothetical protein
MARDAKAAQRAALKRKKREQEVREVAARRRAAESQQGPKKLLHTAGDLPVAECVISKGWSERGLAHILLARSLPNGRLLVGGYYVDTLCVGLKESAVMPSLDAEEYRERVKPNVFNDPVEFEDCDPGLARAIVEGAIEFAGRFGFKPNKRWQESAHVWSGIEAKKGGVAFGKEGKPCLVRRGADKAAGILARLERTAGPGNYLVEDLPG